MLLEQGRPDEARAQLHQLLSRAPHHAPAHILLARSFANQGNWPEAERHCRHALDLDNLQVEAYRMLALVNENQGGLQPAIDMLKKAIYLERQSPVDHFNLAMLYRRTGQPAQANRALQNTIKLLQGWPPADIVPDTGGATAWHMLQMAQAMLQS